MTIRKIGNKWQALGPSLNVVGEFKLESQAIHASKEAVKEFNTVKE